ncbi:sushi, nidogen and EGF-like domain-containing protein 1 [Paramisgurnus dabryanus]|uniref:sushi, nidogen and EGF-like domain-containing protein 1 n=1 Tax=Paramisgurnus dabryanus TaxID=90735 RepID=UPI003CCF43E1
MEDHKVKIYVSPHGADVLLRQALSLGNEDSTHMWGSKFGSVPLGLVAMTQEGSEGLLCVFPQLLSSREFWRGSGSTGAAVARSPVLADPSVVFEPGLPPRRLPISGANLEGSVVSDFSGFIDTTVVPTTTSIGDSTNNVSFYPFGVGDTQNECSDDGSSALIYLLQPFIFFGHTYNQIYVNNNGHLTFDGPWDSYSPYSFPGHGGKDIIAPFWTDLNNCENGVISYQQYTSGDVLTQATQDINQYFPDLSFSASWVFVATWDRVAYYSYSGTETSFQVVLISNGHLSFVLMNYGRISPSQRYVQAGYDNIDSSYYFSITESLQTDFTGLTHSTNVNVTGRWAFRTDCGPQGCQFKVLSGCYRKRKPCGWKKTRDCDTLGVTKEEGNEAEGGPTPDLAWWVSRRNKWIEQP